MEFENFYNLIHYNDDAQKSFFALYFISKKSRSFPGASELLVSYYRQEIMCRWNIVFQHIGDNIVYASSVLKS